VTRPSPRGKLEYVGFRPHRPGRIHLFCPSCGRKVSNMPRFEHDPPTAMLAHIPCERCSVGCKIDGPSLYLDAEGRRVEWDWETRIYAPN
jgi:hypothetical protein